MFLSSHLLAEVAHSADDAIIIDHGRLVSAGPIASLVPASAAITVTSTDADLLTVTLTQRGAGVERTGGDQITVSDVPAEVIGRAAIETGVIILDMHTQGDDLEAIFANLIHPKERTA